MNAFELLIQESPPHRFLFHFVDAKVPFPEFYRIIHGRLHECGWSIPNHPEPLFQLFQQCKNPKEN